jgi:choline-sulfatase
LRFTFLLCIVLCAALGSTPGRAQKESGAIRLDDQLSSASLQASSKSTTISAAEPIIWQNFLSKADVTWQLIRGTMDVHNGDLLVKGGGGTPVLFAPKQPAIDWKLYSAVEVRMSAQGGHEVKIKIGDFEARQKLGPVGQYNVYRFDVNVDAPKGSRVLGLMPTDSLTDAAAVHSIKLIPKAAGFEKRAGIASIGKRDEYRNAMYVHSPATLGFHVTVPAHGHLHFGMGTTAKLSPVTFEVLADGTAVFSRNVADVDRWEDGDVDLARWGGRAINLQLKTESADGAVALWSSPLITATPPQPRLNVLIYTSDTLRADHASVYGYSRDTTPFLKKLGASGVVFEDCQAQATWTKASIASLMTSLYAFTHGIIRDSDTIPPGAATLAEQLRTAGYVTASIVSTPFVGRATGLERGFDYLLEYPVVLREHNQQVERDTDSEALNRVVFPWLDAHRAEPFFLYAHATDPHAPYAPPPAFESKFANPAETPAFQRAYASLHGQHQYGGGAVASPEIARKAGLDPDRFIHQAMDRYDGEILHNDHSLEMLTARLKQLGLLENTLIIVLSDHGEEFWDHGWTGHGQSVYQELTHTLLLMSNPVLFKTPRRVSQPVQLIDVMPTVLDALHLKAPAMIQGQSLLPLTRAQSFQRRGLVVASRFAAVKPEGLVPENATDSFAIIDAKWKFIFRNKAAHAGIPRVELYDRAADREERHEISAQHPEQVEQKMAELRQWLEAQKKISGAIGHSGTTTLDPRTIEQMRSLGYLGGPSQ